MSLRVTYDRLRAVRVVTDRQPQELRDLYRGGGWPADLPILDFLTVRDLVDLGYGGGDGNSPPPPPELHALLLGMFLATKEGSLCLRIEPGALAKQLATFLPADGAAEWAERVARWWRVDPPAALLADGNVDKPLTGDRYRPLVHRRAGATDCLYLHRYFNHEQRLRRLVRDRRTAPDAPAADPARLRAIAADVLSRNPLQIGGRPVALNDEQKAAIGLALLRRFAVVSGGPGTGKTSIIFTLLRCLLRASVAPDRIRLAAPTGRAAQRVTDSLRTGTSQLATRDDPADASLAYLAGGTTIHRLLEYNPTRGTFGFDADNPLAADVVVVDEASMVDVVLMARLLDAVHPDARIVLLGDKDQLPSVEAGAVLANLLPADRAAAFSPAMLAQLDAIFGPLPGLRDDDAPAEAEGQGRTTRSERAARGVTLGRGEPLDASRDREGAVGRASGSAPGSVGRAAPDRPLPDGRGSRDALSPAAAQDDRRDAAPPPGPRDVIVILRHNYRSQAHIQAFARDVNAQHAAAADALPIKALPKRAAGPPALRWPAWAEWAHPAAPLPGGCWRIDPPAGAAAARVEHWHRVLEAWGGHHYRTDAGRGSYADLVGQCRRLAPDALLVSDELRELCDRLNRFRVLTLLREGPYGSQGVNAFLAAGLRRRLDPDAAGGGVPPLFAGAPVMVTMNDHARQLYNGDVGVCLRDAAGGLRAVFPRGGGHAAFPPDALPAHELAFAVTVHKGQGSEYEQVLLALPDRPPTAASGQARHLLTKEIVYTAVTRAKELVAVYGGLDVLKAAIGRRIERDAGEDLWA